MTNRQAAGRRAKRRGAKAEYAYKKWRENQGCTVVRVRDRAYDFIRWDSKNLYFSQVKSYILSQTELEQATLDLENERLPKGAIREVAMLNRRRGKSMRRGEPQKWKVLTGKELTGVTPVEGGRMGG